MLAGLGEVDQAFLWMECGIAERDGGVLSLRCSPPFVPLRTDARFEDAARRMGLAPRGGVPSSR